MYDMMCNILLLVQDVVVVLVSFPKNPNPVDEFDVARDFDLKGGGLVWYARPQLFFNVTVCRLGEKQHLPGHKEVPLVYFSTFELINMTLNSVIQRAKVPMLYDTASNPCLPCLYNVYICPAANVLGHTPLIPCFIDGNAHPTIPFQFKDNRLLGTASADAHCPEGLPEWQQNLRGESLAVALRTKPAPNDVH